MIQIECRDTLYTYDAYHMVKAFFPNEEIVQKVNHRQEPLVQIRAGECSCFSVQQEEVETKRDVTRRVYRYLAEITGKELPWGILTGIRPTKLVMQQEDHGKNSEEVSEWLRKEFYVQEDKIALATEIAQRERVLLNQLDYENGYSLYVGIPFCPSICGYCSFGSVPLKQWNGRTDLYVDALCHELEELGKRVRGKKLDTVYMGGGTPTTLEAEQMERLLKCLETHFPMGQVLEMTVEAGRPDSITKDKLQVLRNHGINRISINPQTMHQKTLDIVGRHHTVDQIVEAYELARNMGFDNINMDLIAGLPGESVSDMEETLKMVQGLAPDSLTIHALAIKRAARFGQEQRKVTGGEPVEEMIRLGAKYAAEMNLLPYYLYRQKNMAGNFENVGYAKVDKAGIYNILIMEDRQTILATGAGATTKIVLKEPVRVDGKKKTNIIRIENVKNVEEYVQRVDEMIERKGEWLWR